MEGRMARVFRGKVAIPGSEMGAYLETLGQFERGKEPLRLCRNCSPEGYSAMLLH